MRLSELEKRAILKAFCEIKEASGLEGSLYLFGSRTNDKKRGGDIDLLWLGKEDQVKKMRQLKFDFIAKIQMYLDVQKIDLTTLIEEEKEKNEFYQSIKKDLVPLN